MKKVRLMLGAAGITPALGLMLPNAPMLASGHPHEVPARGASGAGKTVRMAGDSGCIGKDTIRKSSVHGFYTVWIYHTPSTACIGGVAGRLSSDPKSVSLRTRTYSTSAHGKKTQVGGTRYVKGSPNNGALSFYQAIHTIYYGGVTHEACAAVVEKNHKSKVVDAPLCASFPA